jgi:DNA-binding transcriptional ArsR family regulator
VLPTAALSLLASPRRVELLRLTWSEELPAGTIHQAMPDVTFGAISLQLKQLIDAGLMETRSEGRNRYYKADKKALGPMAKTLEAMWSDALWQLKLAAELEQSRRGPKPSPVKHGKTKKKARPK